MQGVRRLVPPRALAMDRKPLETAREAAVPVEADSTRRQQLVELLASDGTTFEELRQALGGSLNRLEEDLRHVERSLRSSGQTLHVEPESSEACGFVFRGRETRHLRPPSRCPECKSERVEQPRFSIR